MAPDFIKEKIVSNTRAGQICSGILSLTACAVMILGIQRLTVLELDEAGVFVGAMAVMSFAGICIALAFLVRLLMKD